MRTLALAVLLLLIIPSLTDTQVARCQSLVTTLNASRPDVRLMRVLCQVGTTRSITMARAGRIWHDFGPVMQALTRAGICWTNVGEVLAWNNYAATAAAFMAQWRASPSHWSVLMGRRYDHAGGGWTNLNGRHYAAFYVLDTC